jgi:N-acetylglutamate synthase (EC 2.3.1.1)
MMRKAVLRDVVPIQELINSAAKEGKVLPRSLNNIYDNLRDFFVYEESGAIYGCCALHITWEDLAEIRSLVVHPSRQKKGIGRELIEQGCVEARAMGVKTLFLLTANPGYFKKLGFDSVDKDELPHKIWSDCVHCVQFPNCNEIAMKKTL